jgi:iron complex transport system substrate-binding protein
VRVVTLVPAATEIVAALGGGRYLVGVSHECDYPRWVQGLPRVTTTAVDVSGSGSTIDTQVRRLRELGKPVIGIDAEQVSALRPEIVITQGLCEVCAVSDGEAYRLASAIQPAPQVLSLAARDLQGIWADVSAVGEALNLAAEARELILGLQSRLKSLRTFGTGPPARVLCVEWLEPLYLAGHWVPELVSAAGGEDVGAAPGSHSTRSEWRELPQLQPDLIVVMLCGFGIERARTELDSLQDVDALELLEKVPTWIIDGNSYTSRPGPRVVEGAARIRSAIAECAGPEVERWQPRRHAGHR